MATGQEAGDEEKTELDQFRRTLAQWLDEHITPDVVAAGQEGYDDGDHLGVLPRWSHAPFGGGWAAGAWPAQFGGRDAGVDEQLAFHEEMARAQAPGPVNTIGVSNTAPATMPYGTAEQTARFL